MVKPNKFSGSLLNALSPRARRLPENRPAPIQLRSPFHAAWKRNSISPFVVFKNLPELYTRNTNIFVPEVCDAYRKDRSNVPPPFHVHQAEGGRGVSRRERGAALWGSFGRR